MMVPPLSPSHRRSRRRAWNWALILGLLLTAPVCSRADSPEAATPEATPSTAAPAIPSLAELETLGARIGHIRINPQSIFNLDDPEENWLPFRWANHLHIRTRPAVIQSGLLFKPGDPLVVRRIDETERVLRRGRYLYDVQIRPIAWDPQTGLVDLEVLTRDTWTLAPGLSASRSGGRDANTFSLQEFNLFGTGLALQIEHTRTVDRSGTQYSLASDRALGTWLAVNLSTSRNSDGERNVLQVARPFYALDTPWAAGVSLIQDERIDALYRGGRVESRYRRVDDDAEIFTGWARQTQPGWVQRLVLGINRHEDRYRPEPGLISPAVLPADETLVTPFLRWELLQDQFEKTYNLNQIGRTEYVPMGWSATLQLGRALPALGASTDPWLYQATLSRGFQPGRRHIILASGSISGRLNDGTLARQRTAAQAQYYHPFNHRLLTYASVSAESWNKPGPLDMALLGGDSGLRGYPLRYQAGEQRVLMTLEQRLYTDWYWLKLFRVGGATFLDAGRAWGGPHVNAADPGWLANVGIGLRIFSVRAAFGTVLHFDLAVPLNPTDGIKSTQFLIKTKSSF